ncbi:nitrogen regulation protein NR(I) [Undibacterium cyanobacteriorum]|uniref:DNA-binding transcriptional regulator NtrC n=1 Tax=Undibacterium cyanobacteriorum TaxID=3073561 RepID=A0ABY9RHK8_9BURK|nr:nitrogen regulation protein NR(I) [Undibacterium sp. 20NA77.5]WMW79782.1 nitrogen regulation protein NR(I) [Undibacterium sp. 20NA77.5]
MKKTIWIVDDDDSIRWVLEKALAREGLNTRSFRQPDEVLQALDDESEVPQVLVSDIRMNGASGLDLLQTVKLRLPSLPVIIMTAFSDLDSAVAAFKGGAFEYLAKPFDLAKAVELIRRALEESERETTVEQMQDVETEILGQAPAMQEVFRAIGRLSQSSVTVLITGESGSGKELVARALHKHSPRVNQPFIAINTAAIPKDLLESELFGHERGAFTGAQSARRGRFEQAEGGTLFLDEIGDMPFDLQTRLLRVLSDGHFYRVGGHQPMKANVRLIAATHQNLEERVKDGVFREDLFHRLNVIRLRVPSLRERREDIPLLAKHFLVQSAKQLGVDAKRLSDQALSFISHLDFPGNVRQLENLCNWITVMAPGQVVEVVDLPSELVHATPLESLTSYGVAQTESLARVAHDGLSWSDLLEAKAGELLQNDVPEIMNGLSRDFESVLIRAALKHTHGRKNDAAIRLGIGRNTISRKIQELGIEGVKDD